jgi:hypothetical protein
LRWVIAPACGDPVSQTAGKWKRKGQKFRSLIRRVLPVFGMNSIEVKDRVSGLRYGSRLSSYIRAEKASCRDVVCRSGTSGIRPADDDRSKTGEFSAARWPPLRAIATYLHVDAARLPAQIDHGRRRSSRSHRETGQEKGGRIRMTEWTSSSSTELHGAHGFISLRSSPFRDCGVAWQNRSAPRWGLSVPLNRN